MRPRDGSLNILYTGTLPPHPGGSAISGSQLIVEFARRGHAVRALSPITPEALAVGDEFAARHPEIAVTRFLTPFFDTTPWVPVAAEYRGRQHDEVARHLETLIARDRPDVLFIGRESFAWDVPDVARSHSLPSILRVAGGTTIGLIRGNYSESLTSRFLAQFQRVDCLVTPAAHLAASLRQFGIGHVRTVLNAVDLKQFAPRSGDPALRRDLGIGDGDVVVAYVANVNPRKRPLDLVASAEKALRQDPRLLYLVVGDGPLRIAVVEACRERGISDRFRFAGWVPYHRVPAYMSLADIVVMPSEAEGLARVYLEAQASARLLLASDIPPAREVVTDGETGLLCPTGDTSDLALKTLRAAADPELRRRIGRQARERVVALHSLDGAVDAYLAILQELVDREERGSAPGVEPAADLSGW